MNKEQLLVMLRVAHEELSTNQLYKATLRIEILVTILEKELEEEKEVVSEPS